MTEKQLLAIMATILVAHKPMYAISTNVALAYTILREVEDHLPNKLPE